jgi:hypothetical protein
MLAMADIVRNTDTLAYFGEATVTKKFYKNDSWPADNNRKTTNRKQLRLIKQNIFFPKFKTF